jgi:hypothetical protein
MSTGNTLPSYLISLGACRDAQAWASAYADAHTAWDACERGDWLLWILARTGTDVSDTLDIIVDRARRSVANAYAEAASAARAAEDARAYAYANANADEAAADAAANAAAEAANAAEAAYANARAAARAANAAARAARAASAYEAANAAARAAVAANAEAAWRRAWCVELCTIAGLVRARHACPLIAEKGRST